MAWNGRLRGFVKMRRFEQIVEIELSAGGDGQAVGGRSGGGDYNFLVVVKGNMDKEYRGMEILDGMGRAKVKFWTCRF